MKHLTETASLRFLFSLLCLTLLLAACGKKETEGIEAVVAADFSGTGVGDSDEYPDGFLTPSEVKIGLKSVKLLKANDETVSYTILERTDNTAPLVMEPTETAERAGINEIFPEDCPCEFSKAVVDLTYIDIRVPFFENDSEVEHRVRFYTVNITDPDLETAVNAGDVLIGNLTDIPSFNWVDPEDGSFIPLTEARPTNPLQVPVALFPDHQYSTTVTIDLPEFLEIPKKHKGIFTVALTFKVGGLFFYDDTDGNDQFDLFTDGLLSGNEIDSHYYPIFPVIEATAK